MHIARIRLNLSSDNELLPFYCGHLGMRAFEGDKALVLGYDRHQCCLEFHQGEFQPLYGGGDAFYWKIGITVGDLDAAVRHLRERGVPVSDPTQFQDIGYMSHLADPNGFQIELLQQGFEGNAKPVTAGAHPVTVFGILAHVTLRITDLAAAKRVCEDKLNMRLMSVQGIEVPGRKFRLFFYAWSQDELPDPDLEAVANREWLWERPYTLLELMHLEDPAPAIRGRMPDEAGFTGLGFTDRDGSLKYISAEDLAEGQVEA